MAKNQYDLCSQVVKRLYKAGVLNDVMIIGSWAMYFYCDYFKPHAYEAPLRTLDIDFLVPDPRKIKNKVDVSELLEDLGFSVTFSADKGYIKLKHPDLVIEFLTAARGRSIDKPVKVPQLGVNAAALRYLDFLIEHVITLEVKDMKIKIPHPAAYALHKFIIFERRTNRDKRERDLEGALYVFRKLVECNEEKIIRHIFSTMHPRWQKTVLRNLRSVDEDVCIGVLTLSPHIS